MRIRDPRAYEEKKKMRGFVRDLKSEKRFGFIKVDEQRKDYFFHYSDCEDWDRMVILFNAGEKLIVDFEETEGPKGPRAANVSIVEPD